MHMLQRSAEFNPLLCSTARDNIMSIRPVTRNHWFPYVNTFVSMFKMATEHGPEIEAWYMSMLEDYGFLNLCCVKISTEHWSYDSVCGRGWELNYILIDMVAGMWHEWFSDMLGPRDEEYLGSLIRTARKEREEITDLGEGNVYTDADEISTQRVSSETDEDDRF
jgi:hypothetical protein